jgi:copper chaperone
MTKDSKGDNLGKHTDRRQFKTSIHCSNCVRTASGFIDEIPGISHWEVDTSHPDKILTVEGEFLDITAIIEAVEEAGFEIVPINQD